MSGKPSEVTAAPDHGRLPAAGKKVKSISIAICTWNRCDSLDRTLASLTKLIIPEGLEWEVLVVNNNCTDETDAVIRKYEQPLPLRRIFEPQQGKALALNRAVAAVKGELILWTDDDAIVDPNWVVNYVQAAEQFPDTAFFGGSVDPYFEEEPPTWVIKSLPQIESMLALRCLAGDGWQFQHPGDLPYGVNFAIRTQTQRDYLYNSQLGPVGDHRIHGDETEVMLRALDDGHNGRWIRAARVQHCIVPERLTIRYLRKYFFASGRTMVRMGTVDKLPRRRLIRRALTYEFKAWLNLLISRHSAWVENLLRATIQWGMLKEQSAERSLEPARHRMSAGRLGSHDEFTGNSSQATRNKAHWKNAIATDHGQGVRWEQADSHLTARPTAVIPKLFIVGTGRSGTTWVRNIFQAHPHVVATSESHLFPDVYRRIVKYGCRNRKTWKSIIEQYRRDQSERPDIGMQCYVDEATLRSIILQARRRAHAKPKPANRDIALFVVREILESFYRNARTRHSALLVEKTPIHVQYAEQILAGFPEAKLLHVLRDGRDVCVSLQMRSLAHDWAPRERTKQIEMWVDCVQHGRRIRQDQRFAGRTGEVKFEDLKANPQAEIARLYRFAGLPATPELVQNAIDETDFDRCQRSQKGTFFRKGIVGDWRNHFTPADQDLFRRMAGELFLQCGYRFDESCEERAA